MRHYVLNIFLAMMVLMSSSTVQAEETIVAVVDDVAISTTDFNDRMRLIILSSGLTDNADIRKKLRPQILNALIDEAVKFNEAKRLEMIIDQSSIERGIDQIAQQNNMTPKEFRSILINNGVNLHTLRQQIKGKMVWSQIVQNQIRPRILISDRDIAVEMERITDSIGQSESLTSEIFLPAQDKTQKANIHQLAQRLAQQIKQGKAPFSKIAQQFSGSASASKGGDLGWIKDGQLSDPLNTALKRLKKGEVSPIIQTEDGYYILFVKDVRKISAENMPDEETISQKLGLERMQKQAQAYFIDLKSSAYIERRL